MTSPEIESIQRGFSQMAATYDALDESHPVIRWMRRRIREVVESNLTPGDSVLEINAGSGLDARYLAAAGYRVHATDVAPGMLEALAVKADDATLEGRLTHESRSNTHIAGVAGGPFDLILSNLGGLNCIDDLSLVTRQFASLLRPGGHVVLVLMPRWCPWELATFFKGNRSLALRRLRRQGTIANVGGASVRVWYHSPSDLKDALGVGFEIVSLRSLCCFAPPSYFEGFIARHSGLTRLLACVDDLLCRVWPLNHLGDFYVLVAKMRGT